MENPCFCGANDDVVLSNVDRFGDKVTTKICKKCGMMRTDPYMSPEELDTFYREEYRKKYSAGAEDIFEKQYKEGLLISSMFKNPGVVFDIGCGSGGVMQALKEKGWTARGCDVDEEYVAYGREKGLDIENGYRLEGQADLIIVKDVIEHMLNPVREMAEIGESLKPGGYVYVQTPGVKNLLPYGLNIMAYVQGAHVWYFSLEHLAWVMSHAGFMFAKGNEWIMSAWKKGGQPMDHPDTREELLNYLSAARYVHEIDQDEVHTLYDGEGQGEVREHIS